MLELSNCTIGIARTLYTIDKLTVEPGELTVLIGANGAGKSTLLDEIAIGKGQSGTIAYNGRMLANISPAKRSLIVALVESRFSGSEYLSTQEYLELGRFPHTGFTGRLASGDKAIVVGIAAELKLEHLLRQSTTTLSDGERQRAGIARALIQQTPVILLDEPTSFLDYPNKRSMMGLLKKIAQEQQKVVLMASHDLELCLEFSDSLLVIDPETKKLERYSTQSQSLDSLVQAAFGEM